MVQVSIDLLLVFFFQLTVSFHLLLRNIIVTAEKHNTIISGRQTGHRKLINVQNKSYVEDLCGILYKCCCALALTGWLPQ